MVESLKSAISGFYAFVSSRRGFFIYCLSKIAVAALNMLITIIIIRKISVEDFGIYSLVLMVVGFAVTFGFSWSSSAILYYGSKEKELNGNLNKVFWARNVILLFSLVTVALIFLLLGTRLNVYFGEDLYFLVLAWICIKAIEDSLVQYFLTVKKQVLCNFMLITTRLMFVMLILTASFKVKELIIMNILSDMSAMIYILLVNKQDIGKFEFDRHTFREILSFSLWQLFGFSGLYLLNFGDMAVIKYFMSAKEVGIYNSAYRLFHGIEGLSYVISSYYAASVAGYLVRENKAALKHFFYRERLIIFSASLLLNVAVILFAKQLMVLLYGESYMSAVQIFRVLMSGCIFLYADVFYILYCNLMKKYSFIQGINIAQAVLNLILDIVFIKWFGLIGPAVATSLSVIFFVLITAIYCESNISAMSGSKLIWGIQFGRREKISAAEWTESIEKQVIK